MSESDAIPLAILHSIMDPDLNGVLLEAFAFGIYALLVCQTIWKLYCKGGKWLYGSALIVMWISTILSFTADWVQARDAFVSNNGSPLSIVTKLGSFSSIYGNVSGIIAASISDAIIVWRCHTLWQNKLLLIVLIMLLCTAITTSFIGFVDFFLLENIPLGELIQALAVLSSFLTTVSATFLIAFKIILVTRHTHRLHHYTKIINILVQSAAILSIILLGLTILFLMNHVKPFDLSTTSGKLCYQLTSYLGYAKLPIVGIAPTLITFRIAEEPSQDNSTNRSAPISRLTFRSAAHTTNSTSDATSTATQ